MSLRTVPPASTLDGARVLRFAALNSIQPSGKAVVLMNGAPIAQPSALALCQYEGECDVYVFHCAEDWSVLGAARFESLQSALMSAEHGFPGVSAKWVDRG
jgi:hypothetical protein